MPGRGPAPGSEQITRICIIAGWFEFGRGAVQIGGSRARAATSDRHAARPVFRNVSDLIADSVCPVELRAEIGEQYISGICEWFYRHAANALSMVADIRPRRGIRIRPLTSGWPRAQ